MRKFITITLGQILEEFYKEIEPIVKRDKREIVPLSRSTVLRLLKNEILDLPEGRRTIGNWRSYTRQEAEEIKKKLKIAYNFDK